MAVEFSQEQISQAKDFIFLRHESDKLGQKTVPDEAQSLKPNTSSMVGEIPSLSLQNSEKNVQCMISNRYEHGTT